MNMILKEKALILAVATISLAYPLEHILLESVLGVAVFFAVILAVILMVAMSVANHGEILAHKYGEPYGTLILTGSAVGVEVIMLIILMREGNSPFLVRDTIFSALMLDINGILGITAVIGGIRHGEQKYNVDSTNSYISMILVAVGVGMLIPDFIHADSWKVYSVFNILVMVLMYIAFTRLQTIEHRYFFEYRYSEKSSEDHDRDAISGKYHGAMLLFLIASIGVLAELFAAFLNKGLSMTGLPLTLSALLIALLSASPEVLTAIKAALDNRMQTVVNIAFGASLATVLMTIPVVEAFALVTHTDIHMGLTAYQGGMILLTVLAAMINFNDGETNSLEGLVHLVLFLTFVMLIFLQP